MTKMNMFKNRYVRSRSCSLIFSLILIGCAVNPATRKTEFMLVSENQEVNIGKSVDKQVKEEMGLYLELPRLRAYVQRMGDIIGRNSDRPQLDYQTEIIDTPDFNAFAVPGGFVYVHRGLLEKINSADELASVMGHEMAHVAARHSASQISKSQIMNIGLMAADIATGGAVNDYGQMVNLGAMLAFNKFSRDDEREADHFGVKYMTLAGYNPAASIDMMKHIQKLHEKEPGGFDVWFMTHPATSERITNLTHEIELLRQTEPEVLQRPLKRNEFIALLDGMAVGEYNGMEIVKQNHYYNKEHLLKTAIPKEWVSVINHKDYTAIFAKPEQGFTVYFNVKPLKKKLSTATYYQQMEYQLLKLGLKKISVSSGRGLPHGALSGVFAGQDQTRGKIIIESIAFSKANKGYSLLCMCGEQNFKVFQPEAESLVNNLSFMSETEAAAIQPARMRVYLVKNGDTWKNVTKKYYKTSRDMQKLAEYNGFSASQSLNAGMMLKIPPEL